jgi:hypothetical protein
MLRKTLAAGIVAAVALVVTVATLGRGNPTAPATAPAKDGVAAFDGKLLWVRRVGDEEGVCIKGASIQRLSGREFLVGTFVRYMAKQADLPEPELWIPLENLSGVAVYRNLDDVKKWLAWAIKNNTPPPALPTLPNGLPPAAATLPPLSKE